MHFGKHIVGFLDQHILILNKDVYILKITLACKQLFYFLVLCLLICFVETEAILNLDQAILNCCGMVCVTLL